MALRRFALLLIILLIGGAGLAMFGNQLAFTSNLCVDGVSEAQLRSNVAEFSDGQGWLIDATAGCDNKIAGGGGTIQADEIVADDFSAERDFTAGIGEFEAWFYNTIQDSTTPIYRVRPAEYDCGYFGCGSDVHDKCDTFQQDTPYTSDAEHRQESGGTLYCYRVEKVGEDGELALAQGSDFKGTVQAQAAGRSDAATITKDQSTVSVNVGDVNNDGDRESAKVTWTGSLIGEIRSVDLSRFNPVCDSGCASTAEETDWIIGDQSMYSVWQEFDEGGTGDSVSFQSCVQTELDAGRDPGSCVSSYNGRTDNVFASAEITDDEAGFAVKDMRTTNGELRVVADRATAIERSDFRMLVDADWIGVNIPVAAPAIQSLEDVSVKGLESTTAYIPVRNDGPSGEIQVDVQCSAPNLDAGSDTATVDRGQVYDFAVTIDSGAAEDATQTCDVFAYDTDDRSTEDRASLTVETIASCPDADGDSVCDQFDQCPDTAGAGSNAGCPLEERCGDGVDNDGDGQVDENCGDGGAGVFEKAAAFFETNLGVAGPVFAAPFNGLDQLSTDLSQVFENPFGNALLVIDLLVGLIAGLAAFRLGTSALITPFVETVAAATPVSEAVLRLVIGSVAAVAAGYAAYTLISSIVVKIVIAVLLLAGAYVYIQIEAVVPG